MGTFAQNQYLTVGKSTIFGENVRNLSNMCPFLLRTSFLFHFFFVFFLHLTYVNINLGRQAGPFFRFLASYGRKMDFFGLHTTEKSHFIPKVKEILSKSLICGWNSRTRYQNFFDFLVGRSAFWAKVPITKVVQNDPFYRSPIKFCKKKVLGNRLGSRRFRESFDDFLFVLLF